MDNKITKKRLSDFLAYEWILMIVIAVVCIFGWELAYSIGAVKLSVGQEFKYYFDQTISVVDNTGFVYQLENKDTFSYEVQQLGSEVLSSENNLLLTRLSINEGDVIFSDILGDGEFEDENQSVPKRVRAKALIDDRDCRIYSLEKMLAGAKEYVQDNFIKDGQQISKDNLDEQKISSMFFKRNKKDNRFRKDYEIKRGLELEKQRVIKIINNIEFFEEFITNPANQKYLFRYKRYSQSYDLSGKDSYYEQLLKNETEQIYAINVGALTGGQDISKFMCLNNADDANVSDGIVVMAFDFTSEQPELQYESLAFICSTIKIFTESTNP